MSTITATTQNNGINYLSYGVYFFIYAIVLISTVLFFVYSDNSKSFSYSTLGFVLLTFSCMAIAIFYYYPSIKNKNMNSSVVYVLGGLIGFASIFSYVFMILDNKSANTVGIVVLCIIVAIAIIGLAIFFYIFGDYLKQRRGVLGLIINFLFFIPCLFIDFVEFSKREFNLTTRTEYILFISEILLILIYFYAAPLLNNALSAGTIYLLQSPVFLNKRNVLLKGIPAPMPTQTNANANFNANFSISMWVYLNIQTKNFVTNKDRLIESNIFSYGLGKPKITYTNSSTDNSNRDMYNFYFTDVAKTANYQTSISSQKWNNIVLNYSSSKVDLFINGNLETSFAFDSINTPPAYSPEDIVVVGESPNGLHGAICNIVYTRTPLLNNQIVNNYNILMLKNPPVPQI